MPDAHHVFSTDVGTYFVVNVSSPNTPGLRSLQSRESLLDTLKSAGAKPLLVKLSPDTSDSAVEDVLAVVNELHLDGVIASNTTTSRPESLRSPNKTETGGLSGSPIEDEATNQIRFIDKRTDVSIIGVGGVSDAVGAYEKIRTGANLVQLYTGFVFEGPRIARDINEKLLDLLEHDGFDSITDTVGTDVR